MISRSWKRHRSLRSREFHIGLRYAQARLHIRYLHKVADVAPTEVVLIVLRFEIVVVPQWRQGLWALVKRASVSG
jgi:hypothetical protein